MLQRLSRLNDQSWAVLKQGGKTNPKELFMEADKTLGEIHELYSLMKDLAFQQREMVSGDHMDRFCQLSARRRSLKQAIIEAERRWNRLYAKKQAKAMSPQEGMLRSKIRSIITEILHIDRETEQVLGREKKDLLIELRGLRGRQKALQGYGPRPLKYPKFVDRSE
jgi:hypothetical protein